MQLTYLILALCVSACAPTEETLRRERQFRADLEAIGQDGQTGYFTCLFDDKLWQCRQAVWNAKPPPHLPGHEQRDFVRRYLGAAEALGAFHVIRAQGQPCAGVASLDAFFWRDGQEAICTGGERYDITRDGSEWRVKPMTEAP